MQSSLIEFFSNFFQTAAPPLCIGSDFNQIPSWTGRSVRFCACRQGATTRNNRSIPLLHRNKLAAKAFPFTVSEAISSMRSCVFLIFLFVEQLLRFFYGGSGFLRLNPAGFRLMVRHPLFDLANEYKKERHKKDGQKGGG